MNKILNLLKVSNDKDNERMLLLFIIWLSWIPFSADITVIMIPILIVYFTYIKIKDYYDKRRVNQ